MDFIQACRRFIAIDSSPSHGTQAVAEQAAVFCHERGLQVEIQTEVHAGIRQSNVIARPPGPRPPAEFMLQTHLDTIDPGPFQAWERTGQNPFDAVVSEGRIHGLGAADAKLDFLCKLEAMTSFADRKTWRLPPVLVGTFGEEAGMTGSLKLIRKNMVAARMALIGEPTGLRLVNAAKGFANVEITLPFSAEELRYRREHDLRESTSTQSRLFHGKAAHSSTPQAGESAIVKMLDFLDQLPDGVVIMEIDGGQSANTVPSHAFLEIETAKVASSMAPRIRGLRRAIQRLEEEFGEHRDGDFSPPVPTLNIGLIRTHEDQVQLAGCCRLPPVVTQSIYERWMQDLSRICAEAGGSFRIVDYKKPFRTPANAILVKGCLDELRTLGLNDQVTSQSSTNEASLFSRLGVDCVCFGPGLRANNAFDESVSLDELAKATDFYHRILERFCV